MGIRARNRVSEGTTEMTMVFNRLDVERENAVFNLRLVKIGERLWRLVVIKNNCTSYSRHKSLLEVDKELQERGLPLLSSW